MPVDEKLVENLKSIFKHIEDKGLMSEGMKAQKDTIINSLAESLSGKMTAEDVKDPAAQMRLMGAMICKGLGLEGLAKTFTKTLENNPKENMSEMDKLLTLTFYMLKLNKDDPTVKLEPKSLAEKLLATFKELTLKRNGCTKEELDELGFDDKIQKAKDPLANTLKLYLGGCDPVPGSLPDAAIAAAAVTCEPNWTNLCIPDPNSCANWVNQITHKTDITDDLGKQAANMFDDLANCIIDPVEKSILDNEHTENKHKGPPRPRGPGQIPGVTAS